MATDLADRLASSHDRERTLVEVAEGPLRAWAPTADPLGDVARLLDRDGREPGQRMPVGAGNLARVAEHRDLGVAGEAEILAHGKVPAAITLDAGGRATRGR